MQLPVLISAFAGLLVIIALSQPLARALNLSSSVLLAVIGVCLGLGSSYLLFTSHTDALDTIAAVFVYLPIDSSVFIYLFLPLLLFETSLTLDTRRVLEDAAPILLLAIVAVFIATLFIGFALWPLAQGISLTACLLLGAIVATTDPTAVVTIFRDIGAPERLGRLVEGESLLNDAAAIALFSVLLSFLLGTPFEGLGTTAFHLVHMFIGGATSGYLIARAFILLLPIVREFPLAHVTISLALPYLVYVVNDTLLHASGVVGVVAAGLTFSFYGPSRIAPDGWRYLKDIWKQIAFWGSSLIFIFASILIPKLAIGVTLWHCLLLITLIIAALLARAVVLFGLMPLLHILPFGQRVSTSFKIVILWGGMRGALTLALALAVTENTLIDVEVQRFVAILATGFVLFTLLVNGTTLHLLIRWLRLDCLSVFDRAIRHQIFALAANDVRETVVDAAQKYDISSSLLHKIIQPYEKKAKSAAVETKILDTIADKDRITLGLMALLNEERQMVLDHFRGRTVSTRIIETLLISIAHMSESVRLQGRLGYKRAAKKQLAHSVSFKTARLVQRFFHYERWLASEIADRFEILLVTRRLLEELVTFAKNNVASILGIRVTDLLCDILVQRRLLVSAALDAIRLQYPEYTIKIEQRFLQKIALRFESLKYKKLFEQGLIGPELFGSLRKTIHAARAKADQRPSLDLGLGKIDVVMHSPLFADLNEREISRIARALRPRFSIPGENILKKGKRTDGVFFIASGAVEVVSNGYKIRLGRGDFFGEHSLVTNLPQEGDAVSIGYSHLQVLYAPTFQALMKKYPDLSKTIDRILQEKIDGLVREENTLSFKGSSEYD